LKGPAWRRNARWSDRLKATVISQGKIWNEGIEARAKRTVGDAVSAAPATALQEARRAPVDALVGALESRLKGA